MLWMNVLVGRHGTALMESVTPMPVSGIWTSCAKLPPLKVPASRVHTPVSGVLKRSDSMRPVALFCRVAVPAAASDATVADLHRGQRRRVRHAGPIAVVVTAADCALLAESELGRAVLSSRHVRPQHLLVQGHRPSPGGGMLVQRAITK
jgi:hypothetical protein